MGLELLAEAALKERSTLPPADLADLLVVLYGDKKVGKSTTASRFPMPLFLDCEDALRSVLQQDGSRPSQVSITSWGGTDAHSIEWWTRFLASPEASKLGYETIVVDGLNSAYKLLRASVLQSKHLEHENEGELAYGKGKRIILDKWEAWFNTLRRLPYGIVLTAHEKSITFTHNGVDYDKRVPHVDGSKQEDAWEHVKPSVDLIVRCAKRRTKNGVEHVMFTKGNELYEACDPTPNGRLPDGVPLNYAVLEKTYNATN